MLLNVAPPMNSTLPRAAIQTYQALGEWVSQNGWLLSRRGRSVAANASGFGTHRASITSRFDCSAGATA